MRIKELSTRHFVKSEDLNHHGTLYAGRGVEWMVESGLIAACDAVQSTDIVCLRINSLLFRKPVPKGQLVRYTSRIVYAGKTSLVAYVKVMNSLSDEYIVDGYFTYVYVKDNRAVPHGIVLEPKTDEERKLYEEAKRIATGV
ncbi:MAG: acyl-CoA thioesterase [Clostridiales Family XIII bacterium]|jgi:acyl-CoA hydrolase|nr:acyl-CoA thioesterase [Clostridiales Family XIII bacterium]